jgi:hypothetical protein
MADRVVTLGYTQPGWEKPFPRHDREEVKILSDEARQE